MDEWRFVGLVICQECIFGNKKNEMEFYDRRVEEGYVVLGFPSENKALYLVDGGE